MPSPLLGPHRRSSPAPQQVQQSPGGGDRRARRRSGGAPAGARASGRAGRSRAAPAPAQLKGKSGKRSPEQRFAPGFGSLPGAATQRNGPEGRAVRELGNTPPGGGGRGSGDRVRRSRLRRPPSERRGRPARPPGGAEGLCPGTRSMSGHRRWGGGRGGGRLSFHLAAFFSPPSARACFPSSRP